MKAGLTALVATITLVAIASFVIVEDADAADDVTVVMDDGPVSLDVYNTGEVKDKNVDIEKPVLIFKVDATTDVDNDTEVSKFTLNNSSAKIIGGLYSDMGYTATSIDIVKHDGEELYTKAYYSEDNKQIFWLFEVKITFSAPSSSGYFVYKKILSEISLDVVDVEFDNANHTVKDALPRYNLTGDFDSHKFVNTYKDEVTILIGEVEFKPAVVWKITPRSIEEVDVTIQQVPIEVINNKEKSKLVMDLYDKDIQYTLKYNAKVKDYTFVVDWENCTITFTGKSPSAKTQPITPLDNNNGNYYGVKEVKFEVAPTEFEGTAHVNIIKTDGNLSSDMFTNDNTFIYPYIGNAYSYVENEDGVMELVPNNDYFPPVKRSDCKIVVKDASGNIVIDEISGKTSGTTSSEWNYIEMYGCYGYIGIATGSFFIELSPEIGSKIVKDGISYTVTSLDHKTVSVTGYEDGISPALVIPNFIEGFKVTKINENAFYGCKTITSIEIGDYVTSIGIKAFTNCTNVTTVDFGDSVKTISAYAFYNCNKLQKIDMPDSVKTIGKYAFYKCGALKSVDFDENLKTLGINAFSVTFKDAAGKTISKTAANLAGHTFEGSNKVLKLVA